MDITFFINGRFFGQRMTGVQRHAFELTKVLAAEGTEFQILTPQNVTMPSDLKHLQVFVGKRDGTLWEQVDLYNFIKDKEIPLLNFCNTAPIRYDRNWLTVHDLGVFENPKWYNPKFSAWYKYMVPRIVKKAELIMTVSQSVSGELNTRFGRRADAILYNGVPSSWEKASNVVKENIILLVGTPSSRKRFDMVESLAGDIEAAGYRLVVLGEKDKNLKDGSRAGLEKRAVDDAELIAWYARSKFVVSASAYEGFNLPILEGMYFNAIPILSDIPVHREIYGDHGLYFSDIESLKQALSGLDRKYTNYERPSQEWWNSRSYKESGKKLVGLLNRY